ncbi:MAG: D-glycero-beta-D-manno-heptose 1-phosphate adenylyltransferase [Longimicrobiales bacterium]|nr:D-glycero-beta-D-manno-heptose 1-phosphate adenylyltransferase [Longimicrobiales bacterium]
MSAPRDPVEKLLERRAAVERFGRPRSRSVVFTNGCFDILHRGHVVYLDRARRLGDALVVGVNTDASVRRLKGPGRPLVDQDDRARVLAALECVDAVVLFDEDTPRELIAALLPDVLVKGGDYALDEIVGRDEVVRAGGRVEVIPFVEGYSTTELMERALRSREEGDTS